MSGPRSRRPRLLIICPSRLHKPAQHLHLLAHLSSLQLRAPVVFSSPLLTGPLETLCLRSVPSSSLQNYLLRPSCVALHLRSCMYLCPDLHVHQNIPTLGLAEQPSLRNIPQLPPKCEGSNANVLNTACARGSDWAEPRNNYLLNTENKTLCVQAKNSNTQKNK